MGEGENGITVGSFVATGDDKIAECCREFGADVIMTSKSCRNGTERCNEAHQKLGNKYDIIVNIQGDEPLVEPEIIHGIVKALQSSFGKVTIQIDRVVMLGIVAGEYSVARKQKWTFKEFGNRIPVV